MFILNQYRLIVYGGYCGKKDVQEAGFKGTDLRWADFQGINLKEANLDGANLEAAFLGEIYGLAFDQLSKAKILYNASLEEKLRNSGIDVIGDVPWGSHFCQFYRTKGDLMNILIPYLKAILENNEFCIWIISEYPNEEEVKETLRKSIPNLDNFIQKGQIEFVPYAD